jgi:hypothetical protein
VREKGGEELARDTALQPHPYITEEFLRHLEENPGNNVLAAPTTNKQMLKAQQQMLQVTMRVCCVHPRTKGVVFVRACLPVV